MKYTTIKGEKKKKSIKHRDMNNKKKLYKHQKMNLNKFKTR